jgi:hypothetical protein
VFPFNNSAPSFDVDAIQFELAGFTNVLVINGTCSYTTQALLPQTLGTLYVIDHSNPQYPTNLWKDKTREVRVID